MPTEFTLPELGENVTAGDVVRVLVKPGDTVAKDQPVLELETDKATIEVPSSVAGTVKDVKVKTGEKVKVGQAILTVDDGAAAAEKPDKRDAQAPAAGPKAQPSDAVAEGGVSQKATPETQEPAGARAKAEASAKADRKRAEEFDEEEAREQPPEPPRQKRGEVVDIGRGSRAAPAAAPAQAPEAPSGPAAPAAPSVRRVARELGVDIRQVQGSGAGGRISVDDVQAFVRQVMAGGAAPAGAPAGPGAARALPDFAKWGEVERKPMSNIRRKTSEHLGYAWNVIPHVTQHDKADITGFEALRKQFGSQVEKAGGKLTVTAVALKILATAIRKFPQFASSIDARAGEIVYKKYAHIAVAVDTDRGLLVPVIRDVDAKGVTELAAELQKLSEKARAGKLSLDEMSGGVITITNLGGIGGTSFTPIVNWPEVAILGISRGGYEPVFDGKDFQPRLMLPLSLSYDHRVIDGADAARFLRWVAQAFEQPFVMAL